MLIKPDAHTVPAIAILINAIPLWVAYSWTNTGVTIITIAPKGQTTDKAIAIQVH
jgi:hypothetical protein